METERQKQHREQAQRMAQYQQPITPCIYCGSTEKISDEHLFAKWMKDYLNPGHGKSIHRTQRLSTNGPIDSVQTGKLHRPGDQRGLKLRVVCKRCNETWLSQMQEKEAKPILGPLLLGQFKPLTRTESLALVRWVMMYTFVAEFMNPTWLAIPQSERDYFRFSRIPSARWRVYASAYAPPPDGVGPMFLRPATVDLETPDELQHTLPWDTFFLAVAPNQMFFLVTYSHSREMTAENFEKWDKLAAILGLLRLWPLPSTSIELDHKRMSVGDHQYCINVFNKALRLRGGSAEEAILDELLNPTPSMIPDYSAVKADGKPL